VAIGVKPTWACPGFGYIELGASETSDGGTLHHAVRFREKPNAELAETFLRQGNFRWNAGMFVWSVPAVLSEFNRHTPKLATFIAQLRTPDQFERTLQSQFARLPKISFDYAIMEKADRVLVVEAQFDWDDVGGWRAVSHYLPHDEGDNAANCQLATLDATNNIVFAQDATCVALLGVNNLIVIRTGDALLVCHRMHAEKIKNLVAKLPPKLQ
jgi:mannose-1-phosphate guanylyltransferase